MNEYFSIFMESNEDMGILYDSYEPILGITEEFLNLVSNETNKLIKHPTSEKNNLNNEIKKFKSDTSCKMKASQIDLNKITMTVKKVKKFKSDLDSLLRDFIKVKDKLSFGGNYMRAVIKRPKVYSKEIDNEKYEIINNNIRNINRAMDWIEKVIIDLYNLADQDLNILIIVNRIYNKRHIYESLPNGIKITEDVADSVIPMLPGNHAPVTEATPWIVNTRDKKTGNPANYISRNHDMANYGEDDKPHIDNSDIDSYKRPASSINHDNTPVSKPDNISSEMNNETEKDELRTPSGVNNYYYYNYNNSLNKNTNSFNKHHSSHDDHSTGKRVNSDNNTSSSVDSNDFHSLEEVDFQFVESSSYYLDENMYDNHIMKKWFIKSDNGVDNCCIQVKGYSKPMRGRSVIIVLKKINDEWNTLIKHKPNGQWEFPGGGWDKGESPKEAAIRELHEEAQSKVKNVKRLGTQIQFNANKFAVSPWVKQHVKNSDDWWYGYYSAIFIGEEDGKFTGHIEEEDFEDTFGWKPLSFIAKRFPKKLLDSIEKYIQKEFKESITEDYISEAVDVRNKKFDKAYKAAFNYDNGHMIKITYSLQDCEVTNVGLSKAMRDHVASVAEEVNKENHRGLKATKHIRSFMVMLKGIINYKHHVRKRKEMLTNFLNDYIGDIGYLDFQAKDCKIIGIYDLYEKKEITDEIRIVGIFAARHMISGKSLCLNDKDLKSVHDLLESGRTKFHISTYKVGDIEKWPTFMSTYWDDKGDHSIVNINNEIIDSDEANRSTDMELNNIPDIIGDLEMKGFHVSDEESIKYLSKYRSSDKWIPDVISVDTKKDVVKKESYEPWKMDLDFQSKVFTEAVGDADDNRPESDHPIRDTIQDIDKELMKHQQKSKQTMQNVKSVARAAMKPVNRTKDWISNMISNWKDADETNIKERMADPHARSNLFSAIKKAIAAGSLLKAGLLLNPIFLFLTVTRGIGKNKKEFRIRNEMIGELKTEIEICETKIQDADRNGDNKAKYQLMRFKNELNKKLLRVGGGKGWSKII